MATKSNKRLFQNYQTRFGKLFYNKKSLAVTLTNNGPPKNTQGTALFFTTTVLLQKNVHGNCIFNLTDLIHFKFNRFPFLIFQDSKFSSKNFS